MADRGIKFAKDGKTISSTDPDDYNFWTKYPPLNFLEKKTVTITATPSNYSGTTEVSHSYDFIPMVIGTIQRTSGMTPSSEFQMPCSYFTALPCDFGLFETVNFNFSILSNKVNITWTASCGVMGYEEGPTVNVKFVAKLYFYLFPLGKSFS